MRRFEQRDDHVIVGAFGERRVSRLERRVAADEIGADPRRLRPADANDTEPAAARRRCDGNDGVGGGEQATSQK